MHQITLYKSDGTRQTAGASLAAGTYYGELSPGDFEHARLGSFLFKYDAALVATVTFEATNILEVHVWDLAANGWVAAPAPTPSALSTLNISASAGVESRYAIDLPFGRLRFKVVVTTAGVLDAFESVKG